MLISAQSSATWPHCIINGGGCFRNVWQPFTKQSRKPSRLFVEKYASNGLTPGPLLQTWLTFIPAWISNYIHDKVWDEITYPLSNFNGCTVEVCMSHHSITSSRYSSFLEFGWYKVCFEAFNMFTFPVSECPLWCLCCIAIVTSVMTTAISIFFNQYHPKVVDMQLVTWYFILFCTTHQYHLWCYHKRFDTWACKLLVFQEN